MEQAKSKLPPEVRRALARKYGLPYSEPQSAGFEFLEAMPAPESRLPLVLSMFALGIALVLALLMFEGARVNLGYEGVGQKLDRAIASMNAAFIGGEPGRLKQQTSAPPSREAQGNAPGRADDAYITASIREGLAGEQRLDSLQVETVGGVVTLRGDAASESIRHHAGRMAAAVSGVKEVNNHIVVAARPAVKFT